MRNHEKSASGACLAGWLVLGLSPAACSADEERERAFDRQKLLDPETCRECHAEHVREWSGSMHAYASKDPVFLAMNARGQEETGGALGDFCVKCHAPVAVAENLATSWDHPESLPEWAQGVTCYFCHNADAVEGTHNNPIRLAKDTTLRGGIVDPVRNDAHDSAYSALLDGDAREESSSLCGSCHDIVVPAALSGGSEDVHLERTYTEWQESLFNHDGVRGLSCSNCHAGLAERGPGPIASAPGVPANRSPHRHDFIGVDVALTLFPEQEAQRTAVQRAMETTLRVELCVSLDGRMTLTLDNMGSGHNVPSGASQDRRLWAEVRAWAYDGTETLLPAIPPVGSPEDRAKTGWIEEVDGQPGTWLLGDRAFDADGNRAHMFWNVTRVEQGTILASVTTSPFEPGGGREMASQIYQHPGSMPARVAVLVRMRPMDHAVLDDLVQSGHLDLEVARAMPTFDLLPNRQGADREYTLDWSYEEAMDSGRSVNGALCMETARRPY